MGKLSNLARHSAGDGIEKNSSIPNGRRDEEMREMGDGINNGLEQEGRQGTITTRIIIS